MNYKQENSYLVDTLRSNLNLYPTALNSFCVGFSGGIDSTVLLYALKRILPQSSKLRAVHINHQLNEDSFEWVKFCRTICKGLDIPIKVIELSIDSNAQGGPESRARDARYDAFHNELAPHEILLTAHHLEDQAETFLLQLMRGSGPKGLSAMPNFRNYNGMSILRPLLNVSKEHIHSFAAYNKLSWIDDSSNLELNFDRNYLRHEVFPILLKRWPSAAKVISRSARLCAASDNLINEQNAQVLQSILDGNKLDLNQIVDLSSDRQEAILRTALIQLGIALPSEQQLKIGLSQLLESKSDAELQFTWPGAAIRRYKDKAFIYSNEENLLFNSKNHDSIAWDFTEDLNLGSISGVISAVKVDSGGFAISHLTSNLEVRFRKGGERLRLSPEGPNRSLKNLLQESAILPWMRGHIPLVYSGDFLLAVGDLWLNADCQAASDESGISIKWRTNSAFK